MNDEEINYLFTFFYRTLNVIGRIKQIMENFTSGVSVNCKKIGVKYAESIDLNLNLKKINRIN